MKQSHKIYFLSLILALLVISIFIFSLVPPISRDALNHHLAVPKLYLEQGGLFEIPFIKFSYYPQLLELFYTGALYLGSGVLAKLIHFAFGLGTAILIFYYVRKRINTVYALIGGIFFLSIPVIIKLSITAYVDLGLIFFSFASLLLLLLWIEKGFQKKFLIFSAILCGLALSTKYNGLITLFLLTCFVPIIFARLAPMHSHRQLKALGQGALFLTVSLVVFSPWMLRNYSWTGNPVYPLYNEFFNEANHKEIRKIKLKSHYWENEKDINHFLKRKYLYGESWWQTALIPIRIFFQGKDDNPRYFDGRLNPYLFFLPFLAFIGFRRKDFKSHSHEKFILLFFAVLYLLAVFFQRDMRIRYVGPMIPPLVMLSVWGLYRINSWLMPKLSNKISVLKQVDFNPASTHMDQGSFPAKPRSIIFVAVNLLVVGLLALNGQYLIQQYQNYKPFAYLSGEISKDEYITRFRPEYAVYNKANKILPKDAKILGLFLGQRRYYLNREIYFNRLFFQKIINRADQVEDIVQSLKESGITDFIIRADLFNRWINDNFTLEQKNLIDSFFSNQTQRIFTYKNIALFHLT